MNNKKKIVLTFIGVSIFLLSSISLAGARGAGGLARCQLIGVDFYNFTSKVLLKSGTATKRNKLVGRRFEIKVKYRCARNTSKVWLIMTGPKRNSFRTIVSKLKKGSHSIRVAKSNFKLAAGTYRFAFRSFKGTGGMSGSVKMTQKKITCLTKKITATRLFGATAGTGYFKNCKIEKAEFRTHKRRPLEFVGQKLRIKMHFECSHKHHPGRKRHRHSSLRNRKAIIEFQVRAPKGGFFNKTIKIKRGSDSGFSVKTNLRVKSGLYFLRVGKKGTPSSMGIKAKITASAKCPMRIGSIISNFR